VREPQICECTFSALELGQGLAPTLPFADAEIADWPVRKTIGKMKKKT